MDGTRCVLGVDSVTNINSFTNSVTHKTTQTETHNLPEQSLSGREVNSLEQMYALISPTLLQVPVSCQYDNCPGSITCHHVSGASIRMDSASTPSNHTANQNTVVITTAHLILFKVSMQSPALIIG